MIDSQRIRAGGLAGNSAQDQTEYAVEVAATVDKVAALRDAWQAMQPEINADIDFYLAVLASREEIIRPHVVVLKRHGVPRAFLVGRLEKKPTRIAFGYREARPLSVRRLTVIHGGLFGDLSGGAASRLVASVADSLRRGEIDVACFDNVRADSPLYEATRGAVGALYRDYFPTLRDHWVGQFYPTYAEYLSHRTPKMKRNLRRLATRLQDAVGDRATIRSYRHENEVDRLLADCETVASKTYQRGLHVGFARNGETNRLTMLAAAKGWLRGYVMYIDREPAAFWYGYAYSRRFSAYSTAYDPRYTDLYPGLFLLQHALEDLTREQSVDLIDFGIGDAQYKREFCDWNCHETSILWFAPTVRGLLTQVLRTPVVAAECAARQLLLRAGLLQGLKKSWRRHLARGAGCCDDGRGR